MRDVNYGWLLRYLHANGASMFFLAVYIHMFRGIYYGSYKAPREVLWILGRHHLSADDGDGLHGLRAALGPDELSGRATVITKPVLGDPARRRDRRDLAVGRLCGRQSDARTASSRCITSCPSSSSPSSGCTSGRCMSSGRIIRPASTRRPSKDTVPFTPHATSRTCLWSRLFCILYAWIVFYIPNLSRPRGQLYAGQSGGDAVRTSCRNGTTCRSTRSCARSRTSSPASSRCSARSAFCSFLPWLDGRA